MPTLLDFCGAEGSAVLLPSHVAYTPGSSGFSSARQVPDLPPRRWEVSVPTERPERLLQLVRARWRAAGGPVAAISWVPPGEGATTVRFDERTFSVALRNGASASVRFVLEEALYL